MGEEVNQEDPILAKLNKKAPVKDQSVDTDPEDPILKKLNSTVKKKDESDQKTDGTASGTPSQKPTKPSGTSIQLDQKQLEALGKAQEKSKLTPEERRQQFDSKIKEEAQLKRFAAGDTTDPRGDFEIATGNLNDFGARFNKALISGVASLPKAIAVGANYLDEIMGIGDPNKKVEEYATYKLGESIEKKAREWGITITDPKNDDSFLLSSVPSAMGSVASMAIFGRPTPTTAALKESTSIGATLSKELIEGVVSPSGIVGGTSMAVPEFEAAKAAGLSDEEAFKVFLKNYAVGQTERIPISRAFARINQLSGGKFIEVLKAGAQGGLEEGTQEWVQGYLTNKIAQGSYDPTRDSFADLIDQAGAGFFVGFILPGIGAAMHNMTDDQRAETKRVINEKLKNYQQPLAEPVINVPDAAVQQSVGDVANIPQGDVAAASQAAEVIQKEVENVTKQENAVQESSPESVDVREQTGDGQAVGAGNIQQETTTEDQAKEETTAQNNSEEITALRETILNSPEDLRWDGNKVTILTEKGSQMLQRYTELKNESSSNAKASTQPGGDVAGQPVSSEPDAATQQPMGREEGEPSAPPTTDDVPKPQEPGGVPPVAEQKDTESEPAGNATDTKEETGSVALDQPEKEKLSGIKKALVSEEKIESTPIEKRSTEQMLKSAKEQVDSGELNPKAIVDEISKGDARALQPDEVAGLVYYKTQLDNQSDKLNAAMVEAIENGDTEAQSALKPQLDAVNSEIDNYHTMALKTAYEQSLAFRLRQMLLDNEYNLQSQINKYKAANNGEIEPEVEKKFKELDTQLKAANQKIRQLEEKGLSASSEEAMKNIRQDLQRKREIRKKKADERKQKINDFFDSLKDKVKTDPNRLNSFTQVVGEAVARGAIEAVRAAVIAGSDVASAVQAGIDYVKEHYRGTDFDEKDFTSMVQPGLEKIIPSDKDIGEPEMIDGKLKIPASLVKSLVEAGAKDINEVVDQIHDGIKDSMPEVTKRDIRDAITKYGETKNLSKDEIDVKLREMKRVGRLLSSLEDVQNKKRPLRSGLQRDKLTDQERKMQREIKEAMKGLPVDQAELDKAWKNSLDAVKSRLNNQIADLEEQIKTGEKTPKKKGIEYDEEAKSLRERRDKLKAIVESIEGKPKMSDEQKVRMAVAAVERTITDLENRIKNKDTAKKPQSKTPETPELKSLRDRRDKLKADYAEMEKDLGVTEKKRLEAYKEAVKKSTASYEQRIKDQDFAPKKKTTTTLDEEATKLKLERDKIKQQFDVEREKARLKNRPLSQKVWDTIVDLWNVPKSLQATLDMSAPFRQGALLSTSNPVAGAKSFVEMFRQAFSEKRANEWLLALKESPEYATIKNSKLYLAEPTSKLTAKEEQFMSNLAGRIPIIGSLVKGSERAYTGFLNKLRVDVFTNGADRLRDQGITPENNPEAYKSWANFVNNATGRGNLGGAELAAPILNGLFFSPRYVASRFNLLNPATYAKMPAPVRRMALKNTISYIGFTAVLVLLMDAAFDDFEVEWDPRSSDFGKLRLGNTRFDPWAGFQQIVRLISQIATGQRKTKSGKITELDGSKFPFETRADVALNFIRSKLAPTPGTLWNLAEGENVVGEEANIKTEAIKNVVPLYIQDVQKLYDSEEPTGILKTAIPAFFGIGVQSYGGNTSLKNKEFDADSEIDKANKKNNYSFSQPSKNDLEKSFEQPVDDQTYEEFYKLRDQETARLFNRYKRRLTEEKDPEVYDRLMDNITLEATRDAKYKIAKEKGWDAEPFDPSNPFKLRGYKNEDGEIVPVK